MALGAAQNRHGGGDVGGLGGGQRFGLDILQRTLRIALQQGAKIIAITQSQAREIGGIAERAFEKCANRPLRRETALARRKVAQRAFGARWLKDLWERAGRLPEADCRHLFIIKEKARHATGLCHAAKNKSAPGRGFELRGWLEPQAFGGLDRDGFARLRIAPIAGAAFGDAEGAERADLEFAAVLAGL